MYHIPILYQDDDLVVVAKPVGLATHAAKEDAIATDVVSLVQQQLGLTYLGMHMRLDKDTSGVVLFARRPEVNPALARIFEGRQVEKTYLAIVHGQPAELEGRIETAIVRVGSGRYAVAPNRGIPGAQRAVTRYRVTGASPDGRFSLLTVWPETGRTHQIRLHLASLGQPIVGDRWYDPQARPAPRLMLHAVQLRLPHPRLPQTLTLTAPPPAIFDRVARGLPELLPEGRPGSLVQATGLLELAQDRRQVLAAGGQTTAYRLLHGAADGFPDLRLDWYDGVLVATLHATDAASPELLAELARRSGASALYVKHRSSEAERNSRPEPDQIAAPTPAIGSAVETVLVREAGLTYLVRPSAGPSPGLFLDRRETRQRVRHWATGQEVLNTFAYTCGFGVAAVAGGARRVLNLDISRSALDWGQENYRANGMTVGPYDFVFGNVFDWLARLARQRKTFGLVILDPPAFSRVRTGRRSSTGTIWLAERDYPRLAELAARVVAPGGRLVACIHHPGLSRATFQKGVLDGIRQAGRTAMREGIFGASEIDYPGDTPDGPLQILALQLP